MFHLVGSAGMRFAALAVVGRGLISAELCSSWGNYRDVASTAHKAEVIDL